MPLPRVGLKEESLTFRTSADAERKMEQIELDLKNAIKALSQADKYLRSINKISRTKYKDQVTATKTSGGWFGSDITRRQQRLRRQTQIEMKNASRILTDMREAYDILFEKTVVEMKTLYNELRELYTLVVEEEKQGT